MAGSASGGHIITDFWRAADLRPPGQEASLASLRQLILQSQQPATCQRVCTLTAAYHGGALADVRRVAYALMYALVNDCALVSHWPTYSKTNRSSSLTTSAELRQRCAASSRLGLRCYFLPPSTCTGEEPGLAFHKKFSLDKDFYLWSNLAKLNAKTGLHSELLVIGLGQWPRHSDIPTA